jgi:hypothetical protein
VDNSNGRAGELLFLGAQSVRRRHSSVKDAPLRYAPLRGFVLDPSVLATWEKASQKRKSKKVGLDVKGLKAKSIRNVSVAPQRRGREISVCESYFK